MSCQCEISYGFSVTTNVYLLLIIKYSNPIIPILWANIIDKYAYDGCLKTCETDKIVVLSLVHQMDFTRTHLKAKILSKNFPILVY